MQGAGDAPVKIFDRTANLAGAQVISYRVSPDAKWCVLVGIMPGAPERCAFASDKRRGRGGVVPGLPGDCLVHRG